MTISVAILDTFDARIAELIEDALPRGWRPVFSSGSTLSDQQATLTHADVAFVMAAPVGCDLLAAAPRLKFIQKLGAGTDKIDIEACKAKGVTVARLHAGNAIPVAEHTVLLMLAVCRRLPLVDRQTRDGKWGKEEARGSNRHMYGKRVGIVGYGAIGRSVGQMLTGFDVDIVYYDPVVSTAGPPEASSAKPVSLDELLTTSDVVTLHLPLSSETKGIISADRIASLKPGAILINCARGGLVDEAALAEALFRGRLTGAGLDVFSEEPPTGSPLLSSDRTVVTPHLAGATYDNFSFILKRAIDNAENYLAGRSLRGEDVVHLARRDL